MWDQLRWKGGNLPMSLHALHIVNHCHSNRTDDNQSHLIGINVEIKLFGSHKQLKVKMHLECAIDSNELRIVDHSPFGRCFVSIGFIRECNIT